MEKLNVKVGDDVIIRTHRNDSLATVDKITPTGRIRIGDTYYTANGEQIGGSGFYFSRLYEATPERIQAVKDKALIDKAVHLARTIKVLTVEQAKAIIDILAEKRE